MNIKLKIKVKNNNNSNKATTWRYVNLMGSFLASISWGVGAVAEFSVWLFCLSLQQNLCIIYQRIESVHSNGDKCRPEGWRWVLLPILFLLWSALSSTPSSWPEDTGVVHLEKPEKNCTCRIWVGALYWMLPSEVRVEQGWCPKEPGMAAWCAGLHSAAFIGWQLTWTGPAGLCDYCRSQRGAVVCCAQCDGCPPAICMTPLHCAYDFFGLCACTATLQTK